MVKVSKPMVHKRRIRLLVYGPNRSGKSTLAGSAAALMPTLFCQVDPGGSDSLVARGYDPDVTKVTTVKDLEDVWWGIYRGTLKTKEGEKYRCVVIDGVGELAKRALDGVLKSGPDSGTTFLSNEKFAQRREWGVSVEQMRKVIRYFSDLPCHLIWTTTQRIFTDSQGNALQIGPSLPPSLSDDLSNACTLLAYMWLRKGKSGTTRYLVIGPAEMNDIPLITGNRLGIPEEVTRLKEPTFETILNLVQGGRDGQSTR